jgi:hypothetical protein
MAVKKPPTNNKGHHPAMITMDVYELRWRMAGMSYDKAAELCGIHRRTIKRWEQAGRCPVWFATFCRAYGGQVAALRGAAASWDGWTLQNGLLFSPENISYSPYEINSMPWLWAMVADLRRELRKQTAPGTNLVLPFPDIKQQQR